MDWHRGALRFLSKHRMAFQRLPLAVFILAMCLTRTAEANPGSPAVTVDEKLPRSPKHEGKLNFRERYARLGNYLQPILQAGE